MIKTICTLGLFSLLAVSCAGMGAGLGFGPTATETMVPTATTAPTRTAVPTATATATPTPNYVIDMKKFTHFPQSYDYLLTHLDEFVESPDPISERAVFDKWFNDDLVPALGPLSERLLNVDSLHSGESRFDHRANANLYRMPLIRQPDFFYFENSGIVYPVVCFNITNSAFPDMTLYTLCPILFDGHFGSIASTIEKLHNMDDLISVGIYIDLSYRSDVDWGILPALMDLVDGSYYDQNNSVRFGFGDILFLQK